MRISDWSSDVCSSDLTQNPPRRCAGICGSCCATDLSAAQSPGSAACSGNASAGSHSVNPSRSLHVASNPSIRSTSNMGQISTEIISPPGSTLSENQHAQLEASCQLVVNEVNRPHIVRSDRRRTELADRKRKRRTYSNSSEPL